MEENYIRDLISQIIEGAKKDRKHLMALKNAAVKCQQFELAANIRALENEWFPETEEQKQAKESARKLNLLFRMVDLNISEDLCWLINETLKGHNKKKGKFSIEDAVSLKFQKEKLFQKDDQ